MKKIALGIGLLLFGVIIFIYFFDKNVRVLRVGVACASDGAARMILKEDKSSWWPGKKLNDSVYSFKDYNYTITQKLLNGFTCRIENAEHNPIEGNFEFVGINEDSSYFNFTIRISKPANLAQRIEAFFKNKASLKNAEGFLLAVRDHFNDEKNIYGIDIKYDKVKDSSLISVKKDFNHYPNTTDVYQMIDQLKKYIADKKGEPTDAPMLNIHTDDSVVFTAMTAIPIRRDIPAEGNFQIKKMALGNILRAKVIGGEGAVRNAEIQLTNYVQDHRKTAPAIPYHSLITDRSKETDTAKWVTVLNYPIFY